MMTLYTAIGTYKLNTHGLPTVISGDKEYGLSAHELLLWTCLSFRILTYRELRAEFYEKERELHILGELDFDHYLNRLIMRRLVVTGKDCTGADALYDLLGHLHVQSIPNSFFVKAATFVPHCLWQRRTLMLYLRALPSAPIAEELPTPSPARPVVPDDTETRQDLEMMMQHISLRISEKLKSAYPDAIWKWCKKPSLEELLRGATVRIKVEAMAQYTHADISFDRFGRIHVEPMKIGSFTSPDTPEDTDPDEEPAGEPAVVDVRAWYELVGQTVLETQITELNATGHSKLVIKENGDIVINRQKKEVLVTTLDALPGKNYWNELVSILEENELNAKIAGNGLQVSWIM